MTTTTSSRAVEAAEPSKIDIAAAIVLSVAVIGLVGGVVNTGYAKGGAAACALAVLMTAPVAVRRKWPLAAAAVIAFGAWLNGPSFTHIVRCGPALPAAFLVAFSCGLRLPKQRSLQALGLCAVAVVGQALFDPDLHAPALVLLLPLTVGSWFAGRLVLGRVAAAAALAERNTELRNQREENARLAVAADRETVAQDLDSFLHQQIGEIAQRAQQGSDALALNPDAAKAALEDIERSGRSTLEHMRSVVGSLKDSTSSPQPVLAQLSELVDRVANADTRLEIKGDPRELPAGIELSGYRIVEHVLTSLSSDRKAKVRVTVIFAPDALEIEISASTRRSDLARALAAAKERVAIHGGSITSRNHRGHCDVHARLPLSLDA